MGNIVEKNPQGWTGIQRKQINGMMDSTNKVLEVEGFGDDFVTTTRDFERLATDWVESNSTLLSDHPLTKACQKFVECEYKGLLNGLAKKANRECNRALQDSVIPHTGMPQTTL